MCKYIIIYFNNNVLFMYTYHVIIVYNFLFYYVYIYIYNLNFEVILKPLLIFNDFTNVYKVRGYQNLKTTIFCGRKWKCKYT